MGNDKNRIVSTPIVITLVVPVLLFKVFLPSEIEKIVFIWYSFILAIVVVTYSYWNNVHDLWFRVSVALSVLIMCPWLVYLSSLMKDVVAFTYYGYGCMIGFSVAFIFIVMEKLFDNK